MDFEPGRQNDVSLGGWRRRRDTWQARKRRMRCRADGGMLVCEAAQEQSGAAMARTARTSQPAVEAPWTPAAASLRHGSECAGAGGKDDRPGRRPTGDRIQFAAKNVRWRRLQPTRQLRPDDIGHTRDDVTQVPWIQVTASEASLVSS